eukprot:scaffold20267_cov114-Isochrysis_galbana.AAC.6
MPRLRRSRFGGRGFCACLCGPQTVTLAAEAPAANVSTGGPFADATVYTTPVATDPAATVPLGA